MLCELDTGKSTSNSHQACREAVLNLGHRSGRARRTEATVKIRLESHVLTLYRVEFAKDLWTMWLGTCWYLLVDLVDLADQKTVPR